MGERFRRVFRYLFSLLIDSAAPAMLIIGLLLSFLLGAPSLMPEDPQYYFFMLYCVIWIACAANVAAHRRMLPPKGTPEYHAAVKLFGGNHRADKLFSKGIEAFVQSELPYALELFLQAYELPLKDSQKSACSYYIARCYHAMGCCSNARQFYAAADEGGFAPEYTLLFYARCCGHAGDVDASMELYRRLMELNAPRMELAEVDMGMMLLNNDRPKEALEWFRRAEQEGKSYADALGGIAVALLYLGDEDQSADYYRKALRAMDSESRGSFQAYYDEAKDDVAECGNSIKKE